MVSSQKLIKASSFSLSPSSFTASCKNARLESYKQSHSFTRVYSKHLKHQQADIQCCRRPNLQCRSIKNFHWLIQIYLTSVRLNWKLENPGKNFADCWQFVSFNKLNFTISVSICFGFYLWKYKLVEVLSFSQLNKSFSVEMN